MPRVQLKYELRMPAQFRIDPRSYYAQALEQIAAVDGHGVDYVNFCEHHGVIDGYLPSPLTLMAAAAAKTQSLRLRGNIVLPFYNPLRLAEDVAIIDVVSAGRAELVLLAGYIPSEFAMFDVPQAQRGRLMEQGISTLRAAWRAEPFEFEGRTVTVTPLPLQPGGPPLLMGGGVAAAARRAARCADGFVPQVPSVIPDYLDECERLGKQPNVDGKIGPIFLHVSTDPERDWPRIAPHALYQSRAYSQWQAQLDTPGPFAELNSIEELRAHGAFAVLTPDQCLILAKKLGHEGTMVLDPLMGGMPPELGWESLELFMSAVAPNL